MREEKEIKFSLLENARSSLRHAVSHLTTDDAITGEDYKYAIRDVANAVELLFKEKLKATHPAMMWSNVDKYPNKDAYTVNLDTAKNRLIKLSGVKFSDMHLDNIRKIKELRNEIEHYEFTITEKEAKTYIGRMLSFIFWFSHEYLNLNLEQEFKEDDTWSILMNFWHFFEEHIKVVEDRMMKEERFVVECPECGACTLDIDGGNCHLCQEYFVSEECEGCGNDTFSFEIEEIDRQVSEEDFITERLCPSCAHESIYGPYDND